MNKNILKVLEFDRVKALFDAFLTTAQGKQDLEHLIISKNQEKIEKTFKELEEFSNVIAENGPFSLQRTHDLREILRRLELETTLAAPEFMAIRKVLSAVRRMQQYFDDAKNVPFPTLTETLEKLADHSALMRLLSVFDEAGVLQDEASDKLYGIRKGMRREQSEVQKIMHELLNKRKADLTESLITVRNDRQVLPVRADSKSKLPGIVHDISSSGQTLYIEPNQTVERNNALQQLRIEERHEIARIYQELSDKLRDSVPDIRQSAWVLGKIDMIHAKNEFMQKYQASIPEISKDRSIKLYAAAHPLIDQEQSVRNDILFDASLDTIVITGPNTGGKTISIKTVGLLTLMAQAGLPITAETGSQISIFNKVYADIGDEQSIEQSLSTFSSHMTHIVDILKQADEKTLVLLDELGAGTDPKEGAALAKSILEALRARKVKTLATTHYPELKAYGLDTPGISNASMEFDIDHMRPTYKFHLGVPGRSNAIEISQRLGLPEDIVKAARSELSDDEKDINHLILKLESQTHELDERLEHTRQLENETAKLEKALAKEHKGIERERRQLLDQANKEASEIASKARAEAQSILKNLNDKMQLKPHEVIAAMADLDKLVGPDLSKNKVLKRAKAQKGLREGSEVMVTSFGQRGRLVALEKDGQWTVAIGNIMAKVAESDLEVIKSAQAAPAKSKNISRKTNLAIKAQLDLRGTRYEEAAVEIDNYIDQALLANLNQITIVHGIGTGVIRGLVQEKLARNKHIKSFAYAPMNAGGSGATIALLK